MYLFVRERLSWDISDYGFFSVTNLLMSALGWYQLRKFINLTQSDVKNVLYFRGCSVNVCPE